MYQLSLLIYQSGEVAADSIHHIRESKLVINLATRRSRHGISSYIYASFVTPTSYHFKNDTVSFSKWYIIYMPALSPPLCIILKMIQYHFINDMKWGWQCWHIYYTISRPALSPPLRIILKMMQYHFRNNNKRKTLYIFRK